MLLFKQLARFGGVGLSALFIHWASALAFMHYGYRPLIANNLAFLIAFQCSYWGHRYWTFEDSQRTHTTALIRFLAVALMGFLLNQALFALLLRFTPLPTSLALFIVLILVAVNNFIFSKYWAFKSS